MANIGEVYGSNFQQKASLDKAMHAANLYAKNISHKQFSFRNDSSDMWIGNNMKPEVIESLKTKVNESNPSMYLVHILKTSNDINMFPYLINGAVEYFLAIDIEHAHEGKTQIYSLNITPNRMEPY